MEKEKKLIRHIASIDPEIIQGSPLELSCPKCSLVLNKSTEMNILLLLVVDFPERDETALSYLAARDTPCKKCNTMLKKPKLFKNPYHAIAVAEKIRHENMQTHTLRNLYVHKFFPVIKGARFSFSTIETVLKKHEDLFNKKYPSYSKGRYIFS